MIIPKYRYFFCHLYDSLHNPKSVLRLFLLAEGEILNNENLCYPGSGLEIFLKTHNFVYFSSGSEELTKLNSLGFHCTLDWLERGG